MARKSNVNRCPNCGGSDVSLNRELGKLQCKYCRSVFEPELGNEQDNVFLLKGKIVGKGAEKIIDERVMITMKCGACGAEVSINTAEAATARCPWCRHLLSINDKLANGAIPDMILPFKLSRKAAYKLMEDFIKRRKRFGKQEFIDEFSEENLMGVYLPYLVVDMNVHAEMSGLGEHQTRKYLVGSGDDAEWRYDAELYDVDRKFDLVVDDLTIEASSDKLNQNILVNTNNIVNAIMPFDSQNAVKWDARYTVGYACEKRDVDIQDLDKQVKLQVEDIMRYRMRKTISYYDRGVRWDKMSLKETGVKWKTAYMPVWLYSYLDKRKNGTTFLHYVAVNGRTGELVGSAPINGKKVAKWIFVVPAICSAFALLLVASNSLIADSFNVLLFVLSFFWVLVTGVILFVTVGNYKNTLARHIHERETAAAIKNVAKEDNFREELVRLRWSEMKDRNDTLIKGIRSNGVTRKTSERRVIVYFFLILFMILFLFPFIAIMFFSIRLF